MLLRRKIDERAFANAGSAEDARDRDFATGRAIEQRVERFDLIVAAVQALRNRQLPARVGAAEREALGVGVARPQLVAFLEIGAHGRGALVAVFRLFRQ